MSRVIRVTLFKIPDIGDQAKLLDLYRTLSNNATKEGKPYILALHAGAAEPDQRSQGYTVVSKSEFRDLADMQFYDTDCPAHKALIEGVKSLGVEGKMCVYFKPDVVVDTSI